MLPPAVAGSREPIGAAAEQPRNRFPARSHPTGRAHARPVRFWSLVGALRTAAQWPSLSSKATMSIPLQPGDIVADKYVVDHVLAEGGMGIVFAATDTQLDRRVAIKVLSPGHLLSEEAGVRFLQEARAAARLASDHVVKIFDLGTLPSGVPYMVMEMLRGADLAAVLESEGPLPVGDAVGFVVQACEAVGEAHVLGIVHRDLKPANLFLSRQLDGTSRIKVLDFGISKLTDTGRGSQVSLTRTSWMLGSPIYMSPEQLRSARNVDARSDIWALGTILYELLVGKPPFSGESVPELSAKILIDDVPNPNDAREIPLPSGLDGVVLRALHKDLEQRYGTVAEFALALAPFAPKRCFPSIERVARLQRGGSLPESVATVPPDTGTSKPEPDGRPSPVPGGWANAISTTFRGQGRRRTMVTIAVAILVGSAMGVMLTTQTDSRRSARAVSTQPPSPPAATASAPHPGVPDPHGTQTTRQALVPAPTSSPAGPAEMPQVLLAGSGSPSMASGSLANPGSRTDSRPPRAHRTRRANTRVSTESEAESGNGFGARARLREEFGERK